MLMNKLDGLKLRVYFEFKILVLVHKAIYEGQPVYIASLLNQHTPKRCLRSSSGLQSFRLRWPHSVEQSAYQPSYKRQPHTIQEAFKDISFFYFLFGRQ